MEFIDTIKQLSQRIATLKDSIQTEEATKTSFVMPFFQALGYDIFNPMEFCPEYTADVGIKKGEKVDYAIIINNEPIILIGVGNLGSAILKYNRWQYTVGKIVCGYDMDKNKEGERFGVKICHIDKLEETFPSDCKIAILAISENVQETVDRLMKLGIKGIVDFTHSHFMVQEGVEVQTVDVVVAIQELVIKMKSNDQE